MINAKETSDRHEPTHDNYENQTTNHRESNQVVNCHKLQHDFDGSRNRSLNHVTAIDHFARMRTIVRARNGEETRVRAAKPPPSDYKYSQFIEHSMALGILYSNTGVG